MLGAELTRREFVAVAGLTGAAVVAGLGGCAGPSGVSGASGSAGSAGDAAGGAAGGDGAGAGGDLGLVASGTLTLAARADDLPYFQDANNVQTGFAYDLMAAAAGKMGLGCNWQKASSQESLLARVSADGEYSRGQHVRADAALLTCVPALGGDLTRVDYLTVTQCLVVKKSSEITGTDGLAGAKIGVLAASPGAAWVAGRFEGATVTEYDTLTELFSGLQARNVDAVVADVAAANYHLRVAYGDEHVVCSVDAGEATYGLALQAGQTALRDALADALQQLRDDSTYQQLYDSWFAEADNSRGKTDARTPEQGAPGHDKGGGV